MTVIWPHMQIGLMGSIVYTQRHNKVSNKRVGVTREPTRELVHTMNLMYSSTVCIGTVTAK